LTFFEMMFIEALGAWNEDTIPMLFLLVVIRVLPQPRRSLARRVMVRAPRIGGLRESLVTGILFLAGLLRLLDPQLLRETNLTAPMLPRGIRSLALP
jgi:hypothetical protein